MKKKSRALGNLSTFQSLLVQCLDVYLDNPEVSSEATGVALVSVLSALFTNLVLANAVLEALSPLIWPLMLFYQQAASETPRFSSSLLPKVCSMSSWSHNVYIKNANLVSLFGLILWLFFVSCEK